MTDGQKNPLISQFYLKISTERLEMKAFIKQIIKSNLGIHFMISF